MLLDMFRFMCALVGTIVVIEHYDHSAFAWELVC